MILQQICHLPVSLTTRLFSPWAVLPIENTYAFIAALVLKRVANTDGFGGDSSSLPLPWDCCYHQWDSVLPLWCLGCLWRLLNQVRSLRIEATWFQSNCHRSHINIQRPLLIQAIALGESGLPLISDHSNGTSCATLITVKRAMIYLGMAFGMGATAQFVVSFLSKESVCPAVSPIQNSEIQVSLHETYHRIIRNHWIAEVGMDLWRSFSPALC